METKHWIALHYYEDLFNLNCIEIDCHAISKGQDFQMLSNGGVNILNVRVYLKQSSINLGFKPVGFFWR